MSSGPSQCCCLLAFTAIQYHLKVVRANCCRVLHNLSCSKRPSISHSPCDRRLLSYSAYPSANTALLFICAANTAIIIVTFLGYGVSALRFVSCQYTIHKHVRYLLSPQLVPHFLLHFSAVGLKIGEPEQMFDFSKVRSDFCTVQTATLL